MADIDLLSLFNKAKKTLEENQEALNKADDWNSNHGDNMVEIFNLATQAIKNNPSATPAEQLKQAGKALASSSSGSAQLYADGFAQAAESIQGKDVTPSELVTLVQSLMGAGTQSREQENPLVELLTGIFGEDQFNQDGKLDFGDIINAGFAFVRNKNQGQDTIDALVGAIMGASPTSESPHRSKSGEMVANSLLKSLLDQ